MCLSFLEGGKKKQQNCFQIIILYLVQLYGLLLMTDSQTTMQRSGDFFTFRNQKLQIAELRPSKCLWQFEANQSSFIKIVFGAQSRNCVNIFLLLLIMCFIQLPIYVHFVHPAKEYAVMRNVQSMFAAFFFALILEVLTFATSNQRNRQRGI